LRDIFRSQKGALLSIAKTEKGAMGTRPERPERDQGERSERHTKKYAHRAMHCGASIHAGSLFRRRLRWSVIF